MGRMAISLVITGGLRVSSDSAKAIAMGADAVAVASAGLIAAACQQFRICGSGNCPGRGCNAESRVEGKV